jgi:hypothetical protein
MDVHDACEAKGGPFTPFVISADGVLAPHMARPIGFACAFFHWPNIHAALGYMPLHKNFELTKTTLSLSLSPESKIKKHILHSGLEKR